MTKDESNRSCCQLKHHYEAPRCYLWYLMTGFLHDPRQRDEKLVRCTPCWIFLLFSLVAPWFRQQFLASKSTKESIASLLGIEQARGKLLRNFLRWFNNAKVQTEDCSIHIVLTILVNKCQINTLHWEGKPTSCWVIGVLWQDSREEEFEIVFRKCDLEGQKNSPRRKLKSERSGGPETQWRVLLRDRAGKR